MYFQFHCNKLLIEITTQKKRFSKAVAKSDFFGSNNHKNLQKLDCLYAYCEML